MLENPLENLDTYAIRQNLNLLISFHNHVQGFFNTNLSKSQTDETLNKNEKLLLKEAYKNNLPLQLRNSVLLMIFGHLEECLDLKCSDMGKLASRDKNKSGVDRYKTFLVEELRIDLGNNSEYSYIKDCQKIRNLLIHSAGRVYAHMDNFQELQKLIKRNSKYFVTKNGRVSITSEGLQKLNLSVASFTEMITRA